MLQICCNLCDTSQHEKRFRCFGFLRKPASAFVQLSVHSQSSHCGKCRGCYHSFRSKWRMGHQSLYWGHLRPQPHEATSQKHPPRRKEVREATCQWCKHCCLTSREGKSNSSDGMEGLWHQHEGFAKWQEHLQAFGEGPYRHFGRED